MPVTRESLFGQNIYLFIHIRTKIKLSRLIFENKFLQGLIF